MSNIETRANARLVEMRDRSEFRTLFTPSGSEARDRAHAAIARMIAIRQQSAGSSLLASEQRAYNASVRDYQAAMYDVEAETPPTMSPAFLLALL